MESRARAAAGTLKPVSVRLFLRDLAISIVEQLLGRFDYDGALEVLRTFSAVRFWDRETEAVLKHAEQRLSFNFRQAVDVLSRFEAEPLVIWREQITRPSVLRQLSEVYYTLLALPLSETAPRIEAEFLRRAHPALDARMRSDPRARRMTFETKGGGGQRSRLSEHSPRFA